MNLHTKNKFNNLNNKGQGLVELALILPFLLFLTFAIIDLGRYLYMKNNVTNAAREGARAGVVSTTDFYLTNINSAVYKVLSATAPGLLIDPTPKSAPTATGSPVTVNVRMSFQGTIPKFAQWIDPFKSLTSIHASATMRYE